MLTPSTPLQPNRAEVAADVLDGEAVLINLSNGVYYSLVGTGSFLWTLIEQNHTLDAIAEALTAHYDVSLSQAQTDVQALAERLIAENLVLIGQGEATSALPSDPTNKQPYETPQLNIFRDMQAMLALDPPMPDLTDIPWKNSSRKA